MHIIAWGMCIPTLREAQLMVLYLSIAASWRYASLVGFTKTREIQTPSYPYPWLLPMLSPTMLLHVICGGTDVLCIWGDINKICERHFI